MLEKTCGGTSWKNVPLQRRQKVPPRSGQLVAMEGILVMVLLMKMLIACIYFQIIEDSLQTPGNQGGFLAASSTTSSNQEEQLAKLQEDDQASQKRMEVENSPCSIPSLINDDASFGVFERHTKGIGLKLSEEDGV
jgi:hypothetical protein